MKKYICLLVLFLLSITLSAQAMSADEWIRTYCRRKLTRTVEAVDHKGNYVTTLYAGTYVCPNHYTVDHATDTVSVEYVSSSGSIKSAIVPRSVLGSATVTFKTSDGHVSDYQELVFYDKIRSGEINPSTMHFVAPNAHLNDVYNTPWATNKTNPTNKPSATAKPGATQKPASATKKPSSQQSSAAKTPAAVPVIENPVVFYQDQPVLIDALYAYESEITLNGEKITVPTSELVFESTAKEEERLAVIFTPKTGKATMREKPNKSAAMVKNCKGGRYALVLEKGKSFCKVYYNNAVGYILTSSLKFYPISAEPFAEGTLHLNGSTSGMAEINIRNKAEHGTFIAAALPTGSTVRVISVGDTWTEVEAERVRGFVQTRFLHLE